MVWKLKKISDEGADNPIVKRIGLQFLDIASHSCLTIEEDGRESIKKIIWNMQNDLVQAQQSALKYIETENKAVEDIVKNKQYTVTHNSIQFDDPTLDLIKLFEDFVIRCIIAIRRTFKIGSIIFEKKIDGPGNLKDEILRNLKDEQTNHKDWIDADKDWMKMLYDIRGEVEHQDLAIKEFDIDIQPDGNPVVKIPFIEKYKVPIREYLHITFENVVGYIEDICALLLSFKCNENSQIIALPEDKRIGQFKFKYAVYPSDEILLKFSKLKSEKNQK